MSDARSKREERIREHAYFFWLDEGRPEGRADVHWRMACALDPEGKAEVHWKVECTRDDQRQVYVDEEGEESFPASDPPSHTPLTGEGRRDT